MYRHIMIPTDGSAVATRAAKAGIALARSLGAKVTAYFAVDPVPYGFYATGAPSDNRQLVEIERRARAEGEKHVEAVAKLARAARVPCEALVEVAAADEGIVKAARERKCDAIFMGSHGRRGLKRLLLGSVASQVIARAGMPVVVHR